MLQINNYTLIVLPEGAYGLTLSFGGIHLWYKHPNSINGDCWATNCPIDLPDLPPNATYTIMGKLVELTEEQAAEMVEPKSSKVKGEIPTFKNYFSAFGFCVTAKDSLRSLLRSKGMPPENTWVVKTV